jgi:predicted permease
MPARDRPPLLARTLIRWLLPKEDREFILGDLDEVFSSRILPMHGPKAAARWYWRTGLASLAAEWRPQGVKGRKALRKKLVPGAEHLPFPTPPLRGPRKERPGMADFMGQDLRHIRRFLGKNPGFTTVAALTLALGIGANTAVFSVLNRVVLHPLQYDEPDRLVRLYQDNPEEEITGGWVTGPAFLDYRNMAEGFEAVAAMYNYREYGFTLSGAGPPRRVSMLPVSSDFFDVYHVTTHLGRTFTQEEERSDARIVVLSHRLWMAHSEGSPDVLGQTLLLDEEPFEVVGVLPPGFVDVVGGDVDMWIPLELQDANATQNRGNHYLSVIGRLKDGWTLDEARAQLQALSISLGEEFPSSDDGYLARILPLQEDVVGGAGGMLYLLLAAAGLVLLIACVNVANVSVARNLARESEMAIRSALGSGRGRLLRMLLLEGFTIAVIGGLVGLGLARWGVDALLALGPDAIPRRNEISFDGTLFLFATGVTLLTVFLFGLFPALQNSRLNPASSLRDQARSTTVGKRGKRVRDLLVASQVSLAIVLLVGAGLLTRSLAELNRVDLGLTPGHTTTFEVHLGDSRYEDPEPRIQFHKALSERLESLPGVQHAGAVSRLPVTGLFNSWGFQYRTPDGETPWGGADIRVVEGDYFEALGIDRVQGRSFEATDSPESPFVVLINPTLAETYFPTTDPLGELVGFAGRQWSIVGVMEDVSHDHRGSFAPKIYVSQPQFAWDRNWPMFYAVTTATERSDMPGLIRQELAALDPSLVIHNIKPMREIMGAAIATERFSFALMGAFAAVAVILATVGLYGILTFSVGQRTREIGIRAALGADIGSLRWSVLRRAMAVVGVGSAMGLGMAYGLGKVLPAVLFGVSPADPVTFLAVPVALAGVALAAAYLPARKATRVDPIDALKLE